MTRLDYVLNDVCECTDETPESVMQYCPSDWFMSKGDVCDGTYGESRDMEKCKDCWNKEKQEDEE
jgi:hypothetical protein